MRGRVKHIAMLALVVWGVVMIVLAASLQFRSWRIFSPAADSGAPPTTEAEWLRWLDGAGAHELLDIAQTPDHEYAAWAAEGTAARRFANSRPDELRAIIHYLADDKPHADVIAQRASVRFSPSTERTLCDLVRVLRDDFDANNGFTLLRGQVHALLRQLNDELDIGARLPLESADERDIRDALQRLYDEWGCAHWESHPDPTPAPYVPRPGT